MCNKTFTRRQSNKKTKGETKMKTMSKRNKILLGILGAVVVVVAVGLVLGLTGVIRLPLLGTVGIPQLTPTHACLTVGKTQTYTLTGYLLNTHWQLFGLGMKEVSHDRTHFTIIGVSTENGNASGYIKVFGTAGLAELGKSYFEVNASCP
jgi:hypothetical protein